MEELDVKGYKLRPGFVQSTNKQKASPMTHVSTIYDGDKNLQDIIDEILDEKNSIPEVDRIEIEINPEDWVEKEDGSFGHDYTDPLLTDKVMTEVTADRVNMDLIVKDKIRWMLTEDVVGNTVTIYSEKRPTVKLKLQIIRYTKYFLINHVINESDWIGDKLKKYVYQNPDIFAKYLALFRMNRENIRRFINNNYAITNTTDGQVEIATDNAVTLNAQSVFLYTELIGNLPNGDGNVNPAPPVDHDCNKTTLKGKLIYEQRIHPDKYPIWLYPTIDLFMGVVDDYNTNLPYTAMIARGDNIPEDEEEKIFIQFVNTTRNDDLRYGEQIILNDLLHRIFEDNYFKYDIAKNISCARIGHIHDTMFVIMPCLIIFFRENSNKDRIIAHYQELKTHSYAGDDPHERYSMRILDTLFLGTRFYTGDIYILANRATTSNMMHLYLYRLVHDKSSENPLQCKEAFCEKISEYGECDAKLFDYKGVLYIVHSRYRGRADDYNIFSVSYNGTVGNKYQIDPSEENVTVHACDLSENILYILTNKYIIRFNLDTFTELDRVQRPNYLPKPQNARFSAFFVVFGHVFTIVIVDNKRYFAKLSPVDYTIEDKIELPEYFNNYDSDDDHIHSIIGKMYNTVSDTEKHIGLFVNYIYGADIPSATPNQNGEKIFKVTITKEGDMIPHETSTNPFTGPLSLYQMIYPSLDEIFDTPTIQCHNNAYGGVSIESKIIPYKNLEHCKKEVSGTTYVQEINSLVGRYSQSLYVRCGGKTFDDIKNEIGTEQFEKAIEKYYKVSIEGRGWRVNYDYKAGDIYVYPPFAGYGEENQATLNITLGDQTMSIKIINKPLDPLVFWHCPSQKWDVNTISTVWVRNYVHDFINHSCKPGMYNHDVELLIGFMHYGYILVDDSGNPIENTEGVPSNALKCQVFSVESLNKHTPNLLHNIRFNGVPYTDIDDGNSGSINDGNGSKLNFEEKYSKFYLLKTGGWHNNGNSTLTFDVGNANTGVKSYSFTARLR